MAATHFLLVLALIGLGAAINLEAKYPFHSVLLDNENGYYALYWNFSTSTQTIYFAVNVSTTGWVGFGLSPDGQMTGSDVVIGWVAGDGTGYFHDRYAVSRSLPPIDTVSQDWFLTNSQETDGFTLLEFSRNFTSCDPQDLNIDMSTARVVWSFNPSDPTNPNGGDAQYHGDMTRGQTSLNLLGGQVGPTNPIDESLFIDVEVENVVIPSADTTYWCESKPLPDDLTSNTGYITRISPRITQAQFVHHILVYLCTLPLSPENVGVSGQCNNGVPEQVSACRGGEGLLVGAWAVGGEDFVYPEGIAFSIGGGGQPSHVVIEMHYDNPGMVSGTVDNSGLRFYYTMERPEQVAGIMFLGHDVTPQMVIPPRTRNFTITGICPTDCTNAFIPEDGIRIFGNLLHTHVVGRKITLQQFRPNECGVLEEVAPIDQNLNYDFNFQQLVHLPGERLVLPGDLLVLNCEYDTSANTVFTTGGESTLEEMCLAFPVFYPRTSDVLTACASAPLLQTSFDDFLSYLDTVNAEAAQQLRSGDEPIPILNQLDWTEGPELALSLQDSVQNSTVGGGCSTESGRFLVVSIDPVKNLCPYEPVDQCKPRPEDTQLTCCEKVAAGASRTEVGLLGSVMLVLCVLFANIF